MRRIFYDLHITKTSKEPRLKLSMCSILKKKMTGFCIRTVNHQSIISFIYVKNKHLPMVEIS